MKNNILKNKKTVRKERISAFIFALSILLLTVFIWSSFANLNKKAEACDKAKGYTCSYYEYRNFLIRGE
ncbi:MAG: hypothetical protein K2G03_06485 [Bacilli bacterium]|nr:hypothetical protein [Bacilli bacterium]